MRGKKWQIKCFLFICFFLQGRLELIPASWATGRGHSEWMASPSQGSYTHANSTQKGLLAVGLWGPSWFGTTVPQSTHKYLNLNWAESRISPQLELRIHENTLDMLTLSARSQRGGAKRSQPWFQRHTTLIRAYHYRGGRGEERRWEPAPQHTNTLNCL